MIKFHSTTLDYFSGAVGDWRNHYSEEHKRAFKEVCGKQLIELGYERNDNW